MALDLYMIGAVVEDMPRAVECYRRLGAEVPDSREAKGHAEVTMSGLTFLLRSRPVQVT